ncbi:MAG: lysine--tRNA ligase, partial [Candidatus Bathyarchaeia archaeon]
MEPRGRLSKETYHQSSLAFSRHPGCIYPGEVCFFKGFSDVDLRQITKRFISRRSNKGLDYAHMEETIIGHGTWYDKMAAGVVERERQLNRSLELIRTEMGIGASGLPHIGNFADAARSFAVTLALRAQGFNSELIAFSDDKDGLRKIPAGFPDSMNKYIGYLVTEIPDPYKCHTSFGEHMSFLLLEALDKSGIEYKFFSARKVYREGRFNEEIKRILLNAKKVGAIVKEEVGQERYTETLPYFPICRNCGRIYTTKAHDYKPKEERILYRCSGMEIKGKHLEGCGYEGEADYRIGEGKLSWKSEFAVRWKALKIKFEAYGKDIEDSVRINDRICREVLEYEPPLHARYEMFLDKSGKKISKSAGNVLTPQVWFRYGSTQSLILLMLKRFTGTRELSVVDIPQYMNEFNDLEDIYFSREPVKNRKEHSKLTGLYKYCHWLTPPNEPDIHIPYNLLSYLVKISPDDKKTEYVQEKLQQYSFLKEGDSVVSLEKQIGYADNWNKDFAVIKEVPFDASPDEILALQELIEILRSETQAETLQSEVFETARKHGIKPKKFFRLLYRILLGTGGGPRLGPYIMAMGKQNVIDALT